ncbi:MAG: NAD-dependent epimerase/dehydratase family protein [Verrucomicrobiota bacterium]
MKVLVTGGGGFVGSRLVDKLLVRGFRVRSFGRSSQKSLEAKGVEVVCGDLADSVAVEKAVEGMDAVFHVAAKAGIWGNWYSFYQPNVIGSRNIVQACKAHDVDRLIYTSTPSVVFNRKAISGGDESIPYGQRWLCHYAHTKAIAEKETLAANSDRLRVIALRPHLIFGPGDPHLLPRVIDSAIAGRIKVIGSGQNRVDVSYIDDVANAHLKAFDTLENVQGAGQAFFISQGEPVMLWPWVNEILERLGHPPLERKIPLALAYVAGGLAESIWSLLRKSGEPPLTRFVAVELAKDHYFNITKARDVLGFNPQTSMEDALIATIDDLKARGF